MKRRHQYSDYLTAWLDPISGPAKNIELYPSEISYLRFIGLGEWSYKLIRFAQVVFSYCWVILLPNIQKIPIWVAFALMIFTYISTSALFALASWLRFKRKQQKVSSKA